MARALLWALQEGCAEEMLSVAAMCSVESPNVLSAGGRAGGDRDRDRDRDSERSKRKRGDDPKSSSSGAITDFVDLSGDHLTLMRLLGAFEDTSSDQARRAWCLERDVSFPVLQRATSVRAALRRALQGAARSWGGVGEAAKARSRSAVATAQATATSAPSGSGRTPQRLLRRLLALAAAPIASGRLTSTMFVVRIRGVRELEPSKDKKPFSRPRGS
jgi:HrpA-like RNA helicase